VITKDNQLLAIENNGTFATDGIWLLNPTLATGLRLTDPPATNTTLTLNRSSQDYWANVSRDQSKFAVETDTATLGTSVSIGSLTGVSVTNIVPKSVTTDAHIDYCGVAGWTTT
jgi:hypothetical protein